MVMDRSLIYRKSGLGSAHLAAAHSPALSPRERQVLILVNGRRTIAELTDIFGAGTLRRVIPDLEAKGFVKRIDPKLADDWANATITRVVLPVEEPPRRERHPGSERNLGPERHPLVWTALLFALSFWACYWTANRYRAEADARWRFDQAPVQRPIDAVGPHASTVAVDASRRERPTLVAVMPISRLPAARALEPEVASPARAAPLVAPVQAKALAGPSVPVAPVQAKALAAPSPPVADSAGTSSAQTALAAPAPAADPPAEEAATEGAIKDPQIKDPQSEPASDPVTLRPLRHDPPQIPAQALRSGIVEGHARARLWVTPEGKVDQVDIIEATPPRVLDDEVRRVLSLWTYDPPGRPTDDVVELTLKP
jgi:TonB family protein